MEPVTKECAEQGCKEAKIWGTQKICKKPLFSLPGNPTFCDYAVKTNHRIKSIHTTVYENIVKNEEPHLKALSLIPPKYFFSDLNWWILARSGRSDSPQIPLGTHTVTHWISYFTNISKLSSILLSTPNVMHNPHTHQYFTLFLFLKSYNPVCHYYKCCYHNNHNKLT